MTEQNDMQSPESSEAPVEEQRRVFLRGLGKWSQAVVTGVLLGGLAASQTACVRGPWVNRPGGRGWINRRGGWGNRGGSWVNRNGDSWINRRGPGGSWLNR